VLNIEDVVEIKMKKNVELMSEEEKSISMRNTM